MKLTFRQGLARYQTDINGNPTFLQKAGAFVDLVVSPDPTVLIFAHRQGTYVVEELRTVPQAWGPFAGSTTQYLYWDVNLLTAQLTRGFTSLPVLYTSTAPTAPQVDQHWFDTVDNVFRVWNGAKWVEKVRVFAGTYSSSAILQPQPVGSQAGLIGDFNGGHIILDSLGMPLRQSDGRFVTAVDWLGVVNLGTTTVRVEEQVINGMATEYIPAFSLVQSRRGRRLELGRSTDHNTRLVGIVVEDMYEGEVQQVISNGIVRSNTWSFADADLNRPIFCGPTGEVTLNPPTQGVIQQAGTVFDTDAILIDLKQPVILDDFAMPPPPTPPVSAPVANFSISTPTSGAVPLSVTFQDTSTGSPTLLEWDFGNDGFIDATGTNPTHVFATPGVYSVRMRASNSFGATESVQANVIVAQGPANSPVHTNLGIIFGAPSQVIGGASFNLQVHVTNDGLLTATSVMRTLRLRASDSSVISLINSPTGTSITMHGPVTVITLPTVASIASGGFHSDVLTMSVQSTATAVQIEGKVTSPEQDSTIGDNTTNLTIGVRP